jgi:hypothetical protein
MFVRKLTDNSTPILHRLVVEKHGSHNQSSHGKGGKGGGGSAEGAGSSSDPTEMPFRPSPSDKLSQALMSNVPRAKTNAAYVSGFKEGKTANAKKVASAKSWHDMTAKAVESGEGVSDTFLIEAARAIGIINGNLNS